MLEDSREIFSKAFVLNRSYQFWNISNHRTEMSNAGPGLYLAIDPYISSPNAKKYSGANFGESMLELKFAKDTKFLSVKKAITLKNDTLLALQHENILIPSQIHSLLYHKQISKNTLRYMVGPEFVQFRLLLQQIIQTNNISLIEYEWFSALEYFCNDKQLTSAMVYVGQDYILSNLLSSNIIYWPGDVKKMGLTFEENLAYQRNLKLINLLSKLKPLEEKSKMSKIKSYIQNTYKNELELQQVREKLFNCI
jgi:hypothetical protein